MNRSKRHLVMTFGLPDFERQILDRILRLSSTRPRTYELAENGSARDADIVLVDAATPSALEKWRKALSEGTNIRTVYVTNDPQHESSPSLSRPFLAKRVLTVLDDLFTDGGQDTAERAGKREAPQADAVAQTGVTRQGRGGATYRALVVDDSRIIRTQVGGALQDANIEVAYADDGEKALEMVADESFDIIFLDVVMPGMDGYEVCKTIKRDKARRHIAVVMLTSQSSPFDKIKGKFSGCDAYLTKPVRRDEFQRTLDKHLIQALVSD
jgi:two-component system cell cycle response regulator